MNEKVNPIHQIVNDAIAKGTALEAKDVRALRAKSKRAVTLFKSTFWIGIVIFNLALWVPLPIQINKAALYVIALIALVVALIVPILGLRKHQVNLESLKVTKEIPKKKTASEAGKAYIEQVKKQDRPFISAEYEILEGSKWAG